MDHQVLNRQLLHLYWFIFLLAVLGKLTHHLLQPAQDLAEVQPVLMVVGLAVAVLAAVEWIVPHCRRFASDAVLFSGSLLAAICLFFFPEQMEAHILLFLPMVLASLYSEKVKIFVQYGSSVILYLLLHVVQPAFVQAADMTSFLIHSLGCLAVSLVVYARGDRLRQRLNRQMEIQQELLIKNVIMDKISKMDPLTNLYNYKSFYEYMDRLIEQSEKTNLSLQLAIVDIDNFKQINDTYGHLVGDLVLKRVADEMRNNVTPNDIVARYGGEEFAIIFIDKSWEEAKKMAETIRQNINRTNHIELENRPVSVSIGLYAYQKGDGREKVFQEADECLYQAKSLGKNRIATSCLQ